MTYKMKGPSLYKKPVGPVATKKKRKKEILGDVDFDPDFEGSKKVSYARRNKRTGTIKQ
tara:strand:- start:84 stop:260 length:177 start_codon:yes stop_codon:yes gene_type:complete